MVYQHFMLVESMTVAENVLLGQEGSFFIHPEGDARSESASLPSATGWTFRPGGRGSATLSMGEKQLRRNPQAFVSGKPHPDLRRTHGRAHAQDETFGSLFKALWKHRPSQGKSIIFISHKLEEVHRPGR